MGLFNAIGNGLSAAGYAAGALYARGALADQQSVLETQRQERLAEFKVLLESKYADKAREERVARIDQKAGELADAEVGQKRGLIDSRMGDRSLWTTDQQAAVDQSLELDRQAAKTDPKTHTKAAILTGDIDPKDAAQLTMKDESALWKMLWEREKEDRRDARQVEREDRLDERQSKRLSAQFAMLDARLSRMGEKDAANAVQSTHTDGNGYLIAVMRDGSTRRMSDPDGNPITSQSFEQRVDRMVTALRKDGDSKIRKMPDEELRSHVRKTLVNADGATPKPAAAASAPKPAASAARPPLSNFLK